MSQIIGHAMSVPSFGFYGSLPATQNQIQLGQVFRTDCGDELVAVKVGAVALAPGKLYQSPAQVTDHQNLAPTASVAINALSLTVTLGATAATANQYAGGFVVVTVTPGEGFRYQILSHPAADASATLTLTLCEFDPIQVALTTSSRVDLVANSYNGVIVDPTTQSGAPVGFAINDAGIGEFTFLMKRGLAVGLADGNLTAGLPLSASDATAGAVETFGTGIAFVGNAVSAIATTEYGPVMANL